jgi:hypothetical protein
MKLKSIFALFLLVSLSPLAAQKIDPSSKSYVEQPNKYRVDTYDFSGVYPDLQNIDINARKKKHVSLDLSGEYPRLETVDYEGSFGLFNGKMTGFYPNLRMVTFAMSSALMDLDLRGKWARSCEITVTGSKRDITLYLPKDVGVKVDARTGLKGSVHAGEFKKKGWLPFTQKTYENELVETADIVLHITVATTDGHIYLK